MCEEKIESDSGSESGSVFAESESGSEINSIDLLMESFVNLLEMYRELEKDLKHAYTTR